MLQPILKLMLIGEICWLQRMEQTCKSALMIEVFAQMKDVRQGIVLRLNDVKMQDIGDIKMKKLPSVLIIFLEIVISCLLGIWLVQQVPVYLISEELYLNEIFLRLREAVFFLILFLPIFLILKIPAQNKFLAYFYKLLIYI